MRLVSEAMLHGVRPVLDDIRSAAAVRSPCCARALAAFGVVGRSSGSFDRCTRALAAFAVVAALLAGVSVHSAYAQQEAAPFDRTVHVEVQTLEEATAPMIVADHLILSYDSDRPLRYVAAVFEHEDFATRHVFRRNRHDVLFLAYRLPDDVEKIRYRIVVDGMWSTDPNNPHFRRLATDVNISYVDVSDRPRPTPEYPRRLDDGRVEFLFRDVSGRRVYVAGSFSNWDPYRHRMEEIEPGVYRTRLPLREGEHFYHFVSDGRRYTDPLNPGPVYRRDTGEVSRFDG